MTRVSLATESDFIGWRAWTRSLLHQHVPSREIVWNIPTQPHFHIPEKHTLPQSEASLTLSPYFRDLISAIFVSGHPQRFSLLYDLLEKLRDHPQLPKDDPSLTPLKTLALQTRQEAMALRQTLPPSLYPEMTIHRLQVPSSLLDSQAHALRALRPWPWLIQTPGRLYLYENHQLRFGLSPEDPDIISDDQQLLTYARQHTVPTHNHPYWDTILPLKLHPLPHLIQRAPSLETLRAYAADCTLCSLCQHASRTVFGEGNPSSSLLFVGEQPGDQEDRQGRPFVGPAGQLFNDALREAGGERHHYWVSNAVKHFRFTPRNGRRIHQKPDTPHIQACSPWLAAERRLLRPKVTVMLGATGASAILGRTVRVMRERSQLFSLPDGSTGLITVHPSSLLRQPDEKLRQQEIKKFISDLNLALSALA
ncbi:UdgX family uracil-DNA binding protein [Saccharibacter sp. 17.LH.SD]|uniref:UdgX family uracil-DNA binding protein n=1 Tax=Saccharibacter sp. 17.LH.SD TaxID=2689393 RepID=UPI001370F3CD|nr:UdgX family uracil-DNA binding protein [Saccharibacter sp. 17.LH.SD]MXV44639.1 UdgX family uracil-DNA binding protein [Saccharibacter sp. 17.LH.SD]